MIVLTLFYLCDVLSRGNQENCFIIILLFKNSSDDRHRTGIS